jgi:hypothetical protein
MTILNGSTVSNKLAPKEEDFGGINVWNHYKAFWSKKIIMTRAHSFQDNFFCLVYFIDKLRSIVEIHIHNYEILDSNLSKGFCVIDWKFMPSVYKWLISVGKCSRTHNVSSPLPFA